MTLPTIPFFSQARTFDRLWPVIRSRVEEVFDDGKFSHGSQVGRFEEALAAYTGARHAIGVNSGTDALVLLLKACGLRPGDRVLVPAYSFAATATSVVLAGGEPRFADILPGTYAMDPHEVLARGAECRFVMPVHLFSRMADMAALSAAARERGLEVVEDSAEGIGMRQGEFTPGCTAGAGFCRSSRARRSALSGTRAPFSRTIRKSPNGSPRCAITGAPGARWRTFRESPTRRGFPVSTARWTTSRRRCCWPS